MSYRYEFTPVLVPVRNVRTGMRFDHILYTRFRSGRRWVAELTGTGSECVSIVNNGPNWLVRTRAHKKLRVIPVKRLPCKRGTKLDFVPEWNSYRYHVNRTPLMWIESVRLPVVVGVCNLLWPCSLIETSDRVKWDSLITKGFILEVSSQSLKRRKAENYGDNNQSHARPDEHNELQN